MAKAPARHKPGQRPPSITSPATFTVAEGDSFSHELTADEPDVTFVKAGGEDAAQFGLVGNTLSLAARTAAAPADENRDGVYELDVVAIDRHGNRTPHSIRLTVESEGDDNAEEESERRRPPARQPARRNSRAGRR